MFDPGQDAGYNQFMDRPEEQVRILGKQNSPGEVFDSSKKRKASAWSMVGKVVLLIWLLLFFGCLYQLYQQSYVSPGAVLVFSGDQSSYFGHMNVKLEGDVLATLEQPGPGQLELCISQPPGENESRTILPYYNPQAQRYPGMAIALDRIFLVDTAGFLHCHDLQGKERWQLPNTSLDMDLEMGQVSSVNHGQLLVLQPGWLVALDVDAKVLWKHPHNGNFGKVLTVPNCGYIYFQSGNGVDILSPEGDLLAHSETAIPYLPDYAFTADGSLLFATGPDFGFEQTVSVLQPDGNSRDVYRIPDTDFPDQKSRAIHALQMIDEDNFLVVSDAGLYLCDLHGQAERIIEQPCNTARYLPKNRVIAWEPELNVRLSLLSLTRQERIFLSNLEGVTQQEYVKQSWGCAEFSEDQTGRIYVKEYKGNVRRLDF